MRQMKQMKNALFLATFYLGFVLVITPVEAGFVDSIGRTADRTGKGIERKTGQRSDNRNYETFRLPDSKLRLQLHKDYKVTQKNAQGIKANNSKTGVSISIQSVPYPKQEAGNPDYTKAWKEAEAAKKSGKIHDLKKSKIDGVQGIETMAWANDKDRTSARTLKWEGWNAPEAKHHTFIAQFPAKKYDDTKIDVDGIVSSIRWNYTTTQNK